MFERFRMGDALLVCTTIGILVVLFVPIPSGLLDFLIISNFSLALLLLLLTFFMEKPVEFSTFPSLLLIATLFRLSLNVSATRLIFTDADAGRVINVIGSYVVGGNYIVGLVVFIILVVVQYVVVTNGAQRVAEVAARFTLDSIPGQQMSIDADLNMGLIDQVEAQRRRKGLEKEANFYGAMDGASKFVKGDAIAGIIILLVDILGGFAIGVGQMGMKWDEALRTYTLLTIGDGIVTQVPALVIAVGTGIIVTRSASDSRLSAEVSKQILSIPRALVYVGIALVAMAIMPNMPAWPALILLALVVAIWILVKRLSPVLLAKQKNKEEETTSAEDDELSKLLVIHPISIKVGQGLIPWFRENEAFLLERIQTLRKQLASDLGLIVPEVRILDDAGMSANAYEVQFHGVQVGAAELHPNLKLAIHPGGDKTRLSGIETHDPTYGLPATWVDNEVAAQLSKGYTQVDPVTVLVTHINETFRRHAPLLMTRAETEQILGRLRKQYAGLVEELIPTIMSVTDVQRVLQSLLRERVPIRHMQLILEELADRARFSKDIDELTEAVRQKLGAIICQTLRNTRQELQVLTLDPAIESTIVASLRQVNERTTLVLEPRFAEQIAARTAAQVEQMMKRNLLPVLLCAPELRRHVRAFMERVLPHLAIVSITEVPNDANLKSFAVVTV